VWGEGERWGEGGTGGKVGKRERNEGVGMGGEGGPRGTGEDIYMQMNEKTMCTRKAS